MSVFFPLGFELSFLLEVHWILVNQILLSLWFRYLFFFLLFFTAWRIIFISFSFLPIFRCCCFWTRPFFVSTNLTITFSTCLYLAFFPVSLWFLVPLTFLLLATFCWTRWNWSLFCRCCLWLRRFLLSRTFNSVNKPFARWCLSFVLLVAWFSFPLLLRLNFS